MALTSTVPLNLHILFKLISTKREIIDSINARANGSLSILKLLMKANMEGIGIQEFETFLNELIGVRCNMNQLTLLYDAIHNFKYEMIKVLVDKKIPINVHVFMSIKYFSFFFTFLFPNPG